MKCQAEKVVRERKVLEVHIDKGMKDGHKFHFRGESNQVIYAIRTCTVPLGVSFTSTHARVYHVCLLRVHVHACVAVHTYMYVDESVCKCLRWLPLLTTSLTTPCCRCKQYVVHERSY